MHTIAKELNEIIRAKHPQLFSVLSEKAKHFYLPKGILSQSVEAKKKTDRYNATVGIATHHGKAIFLEGINRHFATLDTEHVYPYSPIAGRPKLRKLWQEKNQQNNPSLSGKNVSLPFLTSGITQAVSLAGKIFLNEQDAVLLPSLYWENYDLIFQTELGANLHFYPLFNEEGGFHWAALEKQLEELSKKQEKILLVFNFPNNPTGYSLLEKEQQILQNILLRFAEKGTKLILLIDESYYGLFYDSSIAKESLFAKMTGLNPNIICVKADGATKEFFVWGFRIGFLTFGLTGHDSDVLAAYDALEKKIAGIVRSQISNPSHSVQSVLEDYLANVDYTAEQKKWFLVLQERAKKSIELVNLKKYASTFQSYPFNSGYFLCLRLLQADAEKVRNILLQEYSVGVIAMSKTDMRIAFSSVELEDLPFLFEAVHQACLKAQA